MDPSSCRAELGTLVAALGEDEVLVLVAIARRLAVGRTCYGLLDVKGDPRDWRKEASEEAFDLAVYLACQMLRVAAPTP